MAALTSLGALAAAAALCGEICSDFFCSRAITLRKRSALTASDTSDALVISCNSRLKYRWSELMSIFRIVMSDSISKMSSTNVWTSEESVGRCPESAISIDALRRSGFYSIV
jgi:hypothetical protein